MAFIIDIPASENEFDYPYHAAFCKVVFSKINYKTNTILVNSECFGDNKSNWMNTTPVKTLTHTINLNLFECINEEVLETHIKETYYPDAVPGDADSIYGCMNPEAYNYNEAATVDDGTCVGADYSGTHYWTLNSCACTPNYQERPSILIDDEGHDYLMSLGEEVGVFYCLGTLVEDPNCIVTKDHGYSVEIPENYYPLEEFINYTTEQGVSGPYLNNEEEEQDGCEVCCAINYPEDETINFVFNQQPDLSNYIVTVKSALENELTVDFFTVNITDGENIFEDAIPGFLIDNPEDWIFDVEGTNVTCITPNGSTLIPGVSDPVTLFSFTLAAPALLTAEGLIATMDYSQPPPVIYPTNIVVNAWEEPVEGVVLDVYLEDSYGDGGEIFKIKKVELEYTIDGENSLIFPEPYVLPLSPADEPNDESNFVDLELVGGEGATELVCGLPCTAISGQFILPSAIFEETALLCISFDCDSYPNEAAGRVTTPDGNVFCAQSGGTSIDCENQVLPALVNGWNHWFMLVTQDGETQQVWSPDGTLFWSL